MGGGAFPTTPNCVYWALLTLALPRCKVQEMARLHLDTKLAYTCECDAWFTAGSILYRSGVLAHTATISVRHLGCSTKAL
jgi:hypothetical protein